MRNSEENCPSTWRHAKADARCRLQYRGTGYYAMKESELDAKTLAYIAEHGKEGPRLSLPGVEPEPEPKTPPALLDASVSLQGAVLVCVFPIGAKSEANERGWKGKARRAKDARAIVSRTLGPHLALLAPFAEAYHKGEAL